MKSPLERGCVFIKVFRGGIVRRKGTPMLALPPHFLAYPNLIDELARFLEHWHGEPLPPLSRFYPVSVLKPSPPLKLNVIKQHKYIAVSNFVKETQIG